MVLAPRLPGAAAVPLQHVRARPPDGDGLIDTRTFFNRTVRAEFFDGVSKTMHTREFRDEAFACSSCARALRPSVGSDSIDNVSPRAR